MFELKKVAGFASLCALAVAGLALASPAPAVGAEAARSSVMQAEGGAATPDGVPEVGGMIEPRG